MKKKSPKVYKVKTGNTKSSSVHNVLSAVVMIAAAGLVGFVGSQSHSFRMMLQLRIPACK